MDPRRLLMPLLLIAVTCVVLTMSFVSLRPDRDAAQAEPGRLAVGAGVPEARAILRAWDEARARAWSDGRVPDLVNLYTPDSPAGDADVANLKRWRSRGFTVDGQQTQVLALHVVTHTDTRLVMVVTDRVVGGQAVGADVTYPLPHDRANTRRVVMRKAAGTWLVSTVRDVGT